MGPSDSVAQESQGRASCSMGPTRQDEAAPSIVCALFGVIVGELQCGVANTAVQVHPHRAVAGVEVIRLCVPHVAGGVDEAVRRVHGNRHGIPKVADKEAKDVLHAGVVPTLIASHATWRSTSMSLMKSRIWSGVYKWDSTLQTTSST